MKPTSQPPKTKPEGHRGSGEAAERREARRAARRADLRPSADRAAAALALLGPVPAHRTLDFVVTGTARSGTTALANHLTAIRGVVCGNELFDTEQNHTTLHPPHCFYQAERSAGKASDEGDLKFRRATEAIEADPSPSLLYGNKEPHYINRLAGIMAELPVPRVIVLVRDLQAVAHSYVRRGMNPEDNFGLGRTGLYAAGDWIVLMKALAQVDPANVLLVPYGAMSADPRSATTAVLGFIAPQHPALFDDTVLEKISRTYLRRKAKADALPYQMSDFEQGVVDELGASDLQSLLNRDHPFPLSDVQPQLRALAAALPDPVDFVSARAARHPEEIARLFLPTWLARLRKTASVRKAATRPSPPSSSSESDENGHPRQ